jgi:hypothetical protein
MPVVKFKKADGEIRTISGEESVALAMEEVFEEVCGMTLTQLSEKVGKKIVMIDGRMHMFHTFVKTPLLKSVRAEADAKNVSARLSNRTREYGFKTCPECGVVHTAYVLFCRNPKCECDYRDRVPQEADDEVREYVNRPMPTLADAEDIPEHDPTVNPMDEMIMGDDHEPERTNVEED